MTEHNIWIGSAYQDSSPRVLILGESDYGGTDPLVTYVPQWLDKKHPDYSFARISNTFGRPLTRDTFWHQIAFYNFVPGMVGESRNDRPTKSMYQRAQTILPDVLNYLKPDGVLILGIEQSEYSQPVLNDHGIAHAVSPHPAARGLKNERLTAAWDNFIQVLEARG